MTLYGLLSLCFSDWMHVIICGCNGDVLMDGEYYDIKASQYWNHQIIGFEIENANSISVMIAE